MAAAASEGEAELLSGDRYMWLVVAEMTGTTQQEAMLLEKQELPLLVFGNAVHGVFESSRNLRLRLVSRQPPMSFFFPFCFR
jgi:hypothetical protein